MTLWIRYGRRPFDTGGDGAYVAIQPGDWEVYRCGGMSRYVVMDGETAAVLATDSAAELRMNLDVRGLGVGSCVGYSELMYDFADIGDRWEDLTWRGFQLNSIGDDER